MPMPPAVPGGDDDAVDADGVTERRDDTSASEPDDKARDERGAHTDDTDDRVDEAFESGADEQLALPDGDPVAPTDDEPDATAGSAAERRVEADTGAQADGGEEPNVASELGDDDVDAPGTSAGDEASSADGTPSPSGNDDADEGSAHEDKDGAPVKGRRRGGSRRRERVASKLEAARAREEAGGMSLASSPDVNVETPADAPPPVMPAETERD